MVKAHPSPARTRPPSRASSRACAAASHRRPRRARRASKRDAAPRPRAGSSSRTSTCRGHGTRASERLTCAAASKPSGAATAVSSRDHDARHPVDAKGAQVITIVVVRHEVPPPRVDDEPVRAQLSGWDSSPEYDRYPREAACGVGSHRRAAARARRGPRRARRAAREVERRLESLDPAAQRVGKHAVDLRERPSRRVRRRSQPKAAGRDRTERDDDSLLVRKHERRHLEPWPDRAASHTALTLDRDTQRLQPRDVPPHGPPVDLQPLGDLPPGGHGLRLEELEQIQQARGRRDGTDGVKHT